MPEKISVVIDSQFEEKGRTLCITVRIKNCIPSSNQKENLWRHLHSIEAENIWVSDAWEGIPKTHNLIVFIRLDKKVTNQVAQEIKRNLAKCLKLCAIADKVEIKNDVVLKIV